MNAPKYGIFISGNNNQLAKVGAAWINNPGSGLNIVLDQKISETRLYALPVYKQKKS